MVPYIHVLERFIRFRAGVSWYKWPFNIYDKGWPKETAFLVRIFHVFLWRCSKLELRFTRKAGWIGKYLCSESQDTWTLPSEMKFAEVIGAPLFNENWWANISLIQSDPFFTHFKIWTVLVFSNNQKVWKSDISKDALCFSLFFYVKMTKMHCKRFKFWLRWS